MKYPLILLFWALSFGIWAQAPQRIPYQAVVRNTDGTIMASIAVTITFRIHDATANGTVVYEETHATTTNAQGLLSLNLGGGTAVTGTFGNIQWGAGNKFLQVLMNAGNGVVDLGTQQMMSVPYALYAANSQPGPQGVGIQTISAEGSNLIITFTNGVTQTIPFPVSQTLNNHSNTLIYTTNGF